MKVSNKYKRDYSAAILIAGRGKAILLLFLWCSTYFALYDLSSAAESDQESVKLSTTWKYELTDTIRGINLSENGKCVAAGTDSEVYVFDETGKVLWSRNIKKISRWISGENIVLSPGCDWLALGGSPSYRYVWLINKQGMNRFIKTKGTPWGLAISHKGDRLVIGTGAGHIYISDNRGKILKDIEAGNINSDLSFSKDDAHFALMGSGYGRLGIFSKEGQVVSIFDGLEMDMSNDLKWFVTADRPGHGPPFGVVELRSSNGEIIWTREVWSPYAMIAPDGSFIVIKGLPINKGEEDEPDLPPHLLILDRKGNKLADKECRTCGLLFITSDSRCILMNENGRLVCLDHELKLQWDIPGLKLDGLTQIERNVKIIIEADRETLRAYVPIIQTIQ